MTTPPFVVASLLGDALTLPAHWDYDQGHILATHGRITEMHGPPAKGYHAHTGAGGQTHYGDQALVLWRCLRDAGGRYDPATFMAAWQQFWATSPAYRDHATRETLEHIAAGQVPTRAASRSADLGGAARIAPLIAATLHLPEDQAVELAWNHTALTHADPAVGEAAAFLVRAVRAALAGHDAAAAIARAAEAEYVALPVAQHLAAARAASQEGILHATRALGLACPLPQAFPAMLAIALAYPHDLEAALIDNVMAGGDSAARGLALGMLLGATHGAKLPPRWVAAWLVREDFGL